MDNRKPADDWSNVKESKKQDIIHLLQRNSISSSAPTLILPGGLGNPKEYVCYSNSVLRSLWNNNELREQVIQQMIIKKNRNLSIAFQRLLIEMGNPKIDEQVVTRFRNLLPNTKV